MTRSQDSTLSRLTNESESAPSSQCPREENQQAPQSARRAQTGKNRVVRHPTLLRIARQRLLGRSAGPGSLLSARVFRRRKDTAPTLDLFEISRAHGTPQFRDLPLHDLRLEGYSFLKCSGDSSLACREVKCFSAPS